MKIYTGLWGCLGYGIGNADGVGDGVAENHPLQEQRSTAGSKSLSSSPGQASLHLTLCEDDFVFLFVFCRARKWMAL